VSGSAKCRSCSAPIEWAEQGGKNVPLDPSGEDHRDSCATKKSSPCKKCGEEIVWRKGGPQGLDGERHECLGLVREEIKRPSRHHVSQYKIKRFLECERRSFFADVLGLRDKFTSDPMRAGKHFASAVEYVAVERAKKGDAALRAAMTVEELMAALEIVVGREEWTPESLARARAVMPLAAPKVDLSFVLVDEHGPWVERGFELPVGGGVIVGGVFDLVERVGDEIFISDFKAGDFRDHEAKSGPQVGLYLAAARLLWPDLGRRFVLRYVATDGKPEEILADVELEDNAKAVARGMVEKSRAMRENEKAWSATVGTHCGTCPFQSRCDAYKTAIAIPPSDGDLPSRLEDLVPDLRRMSILANLADARRKKLEKAARALAIPELDKSGRGEVAGFPIKLVSVNKDGYWVKPSSYQFLRVDDPKPGSAASISQEPKGLSSGVGDAENPKVPAVRDSTPVGGSALPTLELAPASPSRNDTLAAVGATIPPSIVTPSRTDAPAAAPLDDDEPAASMLVECRSCSAAGGASISVKHLPPECRSETVEFVEDPDDESEREEEPSQGVRLAGGERQRTLGEAFDALPEGSGQQW